MRSQASCENLRKGVQGRTSDSTSVNKTHKVRWLGDSLEKKETYIPLYLCEEELFALGSCALWVALALCD